jgi:hypothetical protein
MSWLFSQALVEAYSEDICSDGEQSAPSSGSPTQLAYLPPDRMMAFSRLSRFGMTFKPLTADRGEAVLMSYLEAFPVKTSPQREKEQELKASEAECGEKCHGWLAKFDPNTSTLRTAQCSLLEEEPELLQTLPRSGMTRSGMLWERQTLVLRTSETESGLWPTPMSSEYKANKNYRLGKQNGLTQAVMKWPTPTAHNAKEGGFPSERERNTPTLAAQAGGSLNPDWVEWLMNWPIKWSVINGFNPKEFKRWEEASAASLYKIAGLRPLWWDSDPSQTSSGQQHIQQHCKQHSNFVQQMSRLSSCEATMERSHQESSVSVLRENICLQKSAGENLQSGMWKQTCMDEAPYTPRVNENVKARVDRLKAIGNGQVPAVAATAWKLLTEEMQ